MRLSGEFYKRGDLTDSERDSQREMGSSENGIDINEGVALPARGQKLSFHSGFGDEGHCSRHAFQLVRAGWLHGIVLLSLHKNRERQSNVNGRGMSWGIVMDTLLHYKSLIIIQQLLVSIQHQWHA